MPAETAGIWEQIVLQGGILLLCAFVQSAVGFAFSLFSNSLLLLAGLALPETVMLSLLGSAFQRLVMTSSLRAHVPWREVLPLSAISLVALPVGVGLLWLCSRQSLGFAKMCIGGLLIVVLLVQWWAQVPPRERVARGWGVLAAGTSGILTGFANIGGPPLVLWIHAHNWPNERTRVMVPAMTMVLVPVQFVLMLGTFGTRVLPTWPQALVLVPAIALGTGLGLAAGRRLPRPWLRNTAFGLLLITCAALVLEAVVRGG